MRNRRGRGQVVRSELQVGDLSVALAQKRIKNLYVRVLPPDGRIEVSAPLFMSRADIAAFVAARREWIEERREALAQARALREAAMGEPDVGSVLRLWGKRLPLEVVEGAHWRLAVEGDRALLTARQGASEERRKAWLRAWKRGELERALGRLVPKWEERTGLKCAEWRIKDMRTKWGTCNYVAGRLWFNLKLVELDPRFLEYVVLHEVAHLQVHDHGPAFEAILDRHMPEWRAIRAEMNDAARYGW